ncbi:hypothetical protein N9C84_01330 [Desulfobacterales bacterium]|nr:hypothetical protein [Desulfobacterales bacterium]
MRIKNVAYEKAPMLIFFKAPKKTGTGVEWSFEDPKDSRGEVWQAYVKSMQIPLE